MPQSHFILIPVIFLVGFLFGRQSADRSSGTNTSTRPMAISFIIFVLVFITTHIFPYFGGVKAINLAIGGLKILDSSPAFSDVEV